MKRTCIAALTVLCFATGLQAQDLGNQPADLEPSRTTIVYPLRSGQARELSGLLKGFYPDLQIAPLNQSNVLLIRAAADASEDILATLTQIDRPPHSIVIHVYLLRSHGAPLSAEETVKFSGSRNEVLDQIATLRQRDQLSIENRIELTSIENQAAMVQIGKQVPMVAGTVVTSTRGRTNNYRQVATGTLLSVTARTTHDNEIAIEIEFEKSEIDPPVATSEEDEVSPSAISTLTHQSTVQFANGDAVLAGTIVEKSTDSNGHSYLVVTAHVRDGLAARGSRQAALERSSDQAARSRPPRAFAGSSARSNAARSKTEGGETSGRAALAERTRDARVLDFARKVLSKFDSDADGKLSVAECRKMTNDPSSGDEDKDGYVTVVELADWFINR